MEDGLKRKLQEQLTISTDVLDFIEAECGVGRNDFAMRQHSWRYVAKAKWLIERKQRGLPIRDDSGAFLPIRETDRKRYKADLCKT